MRVLTIVPGWPSNFRPDGMPWLRSQVVAVAEQHEITVLVLESLTHYLQPRYWASWLKTRGTPRYVRAGPNVRVLTCNYVRPPRRLLFRRVSFPLMERAARHALGEDGVTPFDVIHAHFASPAGTLARVLGREGGRPYVVTEHSSRFDRMLALGVDVPRVIRDASRVVCVSPGIEREIRTGVGEDLANLCVIPNPVDTGAYNPAKRRARTEGKLRLLFVGHLIPRKGVHVLLAALHRLVTAGMDAQLTVIGTGAERSRLRRQAASLGVAPRVRFAGALPHEETAAYYDDCDVVVLPSFAESFGVVVIEALAAGKPVVATRCGGPEHIIDESTGVIVEPGDSEALADAIRRVDAQYERFEPSRLAEFVAHRYSLESVGGQIGAVYAEAAAGGMRSLVS